MNAMDKKQPSQEYITSILDAIKQNKNNGASPTKIHETLKRLSGCNKESKIVSYPQIARLLRGYLFSKGYVRYTSKGHLPSKENFYKITSTGREFLEGSKIDSLDYADSIMLPRDCLNDCGKEKMEECWKEELQWIEGFFKIKLNAFQIKKIKELLKEPVKIAQIENYKELLDQMEKEISPFYKKNLYPREQKILEIIKKSK